jgi:hypothetical protein
VPEELSSVCELSVLLQEHDLSPVFELKWHEAMPPSPKMLPKSRFVVCLSKQNFPLHIFIASAILLL